MSILILNGSPSGKNGNCQILVKKLTSEFKADTAWSKKNSIDVIHLSEIKWSASDKKLIFTKIKKASGFIFLTGTYWDSWGSPLQLFLENVTDLEGTPAFVGKPAAVLVLNHSVGGKGILSRLQGVLSTFGCLIPPMTGFVYSWATQQLLEKSNNAMGAEKDLWSLDDISHIIENFKLALKIKLPWKIWPLDEKDYRQVWLD